MLRNLITYLYTGLSQYLYNLNLLKIFLYEGNIYRYFIHKSVYLKYALDNIIDSGLSEISSVSNAEIDTYVIFYLRQYLDILCFFQYNKNIKKLG